MTTGSEVGWRRLHPLSVPVNLLPRTWRLVRQFWPLLLVMIYGGAGRENFVDGIFLALFLLTTVGGTFLHWATLRYRVADGRLEIRTGILNRQTRVLAPDRIQNIELVRNVFHSLSGLVEVKIETASGTEVEGTLSALSVGEAQALVDALDAARRHASRPPEQLAEKLPVVVDNDVRDLIRYGLTATRLTAALVVVGVGMEAVQLTDPEGLVRTSGALGVIGGVAVVIALFSGTWIVGTVSAVLRHHGFRLLERGDGLVAEEGLFTRRTVELPVAKVQLVTVAEPWLRRLAGFSSIHIETAAAREGGGGTQRSETMVPVVLPDHVKRVLQSAVRGIDVDLGTVLLHPPHPRALVRNLGRAALRGLLLAGALAWWLWPWGLAGLALVPLLMVAAWLDHRHQGWLITDEVVIAREGYLNRQTRIVARAKLQSTEVSQGVLLRRYGLGRLALRVAGNTVALPVLAMDQALALQDGLVRGTRSGA